VGFPSGDVVVHVISAGPTPWCVPSPSLRRCVPWLIELVRRLASRLSSGIMRLVSAFLRSHYLGRQVGPLPPPKNRFMPGPASRLGPMSPLLGQSNHSPPPGRSLAAALSPFFFAVVGQVDRVPLAGGAAPSVVAQFWIVHPPPASG